MLKKTVLNSIMNYLTALLTIIYLPSSLAGAINPNPPDVTVKLIFIHHSTGENWLADYDGGSKRSRGMMRFIIKKDIDVRLDALAKCDCYPVNCTQYIDLTPEKRRHIFSRSSTNMNSLHVLAMAMGILDNHPVDVDEILSAAHLSYTESLSFENQ